jgi:hypothetical protein
MKQILSIRHALIIAQRFRFDKVADEIETSVDPYPVTLASTFAVSVVASD